MYEFFQNIPNRLKKIEEEISQSKKRAEKIDKFESKFDKLESELNARTIIQYFILGFVSIVLIACFLTFVTLTKDYFNFTKETRQRFHDKLDKLEKENLDLKLDKLINSKLDSINRLDKDS